MRQLFFSRFFKVSLLQFIMQLTAVTTTVVTIIRSGNNSSLRTCTQLQVMYSEYSIGSLTIVYYGYKYRYLVHCTKYFTSKDGDVIRPINSAYFSSIRHFLKSKQTQKLFYTLTVHRTLENEIFRWADI
jgi:hypothetical protein